MKDMPRVSSGNASSYSTTWWTLEKEQPAGGSLGYTDRTPPASFLFSPSLKEKLLVFFPGEPPSQWLPLLLSIIKGKANKTTVFVEFKHSTHP